MQLHQLPKRILSDKGRLLCSLFVTGNLPFPTHSGAGDDYACKQVQSDGIYASSCQCESCLTGFYSDSGSCSPCLTGIESLLAFIKFRRHSQVHSGDVERQQLGLLRVPNLLLWSIRQLDHQWLRCLFALIYNARNITINTYSGNYVANCEDFTSDGVCESACACDVCAAGYYLNGAGYCSSCLMFSAILCAHIFCRQPGTL